MNIPCKYCKQLVERTTGKKVAVCFECAAENARKYARKYAKKHKK